MLATKHWNNPQDIQQMVQRLVEVPSITGTNAEREMAHILLQWIATIPYFHDHPEHLFRFALEEDSLGRLTIMALYRARPESKSTVVLLSHYDVVGVDDYGHLQEYAFSPNEYTRKLKEEITSLSSDVRDDLMSGNWLFGRGTMDMKAGLAIQLAVLSELSQDEGFAGNVLLVSTPDEEMHSQGMFSAVKALLDLKHEYGLDYEACICSEPNIGSGEQPEKTVYTGSVGKVMPLIFCVGQETHVGEPLQGINAAWMAAAMVQEMELSSEFMDQHQGERTPPPTCLKLRDLKESYSVQTPGMAYLLYNILTNSQMPAEIMRKTGQAAQRAAQTMMEKLKMIYEGMETTSGQQQDYSWEHMRPQIFNYADLYRRGEQLFGLAFVQDMHETAHRALLEDPDPHHMTVQLSKKLSGYFVQEAPFYLVMMVPPYYPHVYLREDIEQEFKLRNDLRSALDDLKVEHDETVALKTFFPGLSDVSYCRIMESDQVVPAIREHMPALGYSYRMPLDEMVQLNIPTINIGPYGKDAHKRTERVELDYSTRVVPELIKALIYKVLQK